MIEIASKLILPIVFGFLVGLAAIAWIDPQTSGGSLLLLLTCIALSLAASGFTKSIRRLLRARKSFPSARPAVRKLPETSNAEPSSEPQTVISSNPPSEPVTNPVAMAGDKPDDEKPQPV